MPAFRLSLTVCRAAPSDGGVVADRSSLAADAFMRPVAIAPMRTRHVLGDVSAALSPTLSFLARSCFDFGETLRRYFLYLKIFTKVL
jgi:hypothetical protein